MAKPSLTQVFGVNATQDANTVTISKADLVDVGLTPAAVNSAEALLVALLLKAKNTLTDANQTNNPEQVVTFDEGLTSLTTRNGQSYKVRPITVNLEKLDPDAGIDPDDY